MLKTTISQTSQSREASLTSHTTATGQPAAQGNSKTNKNTALKQVAALQNFPAGKQNLVTKQGGGTRNTAAGKPA